MCDIGLFELKCKFKTWYLANILTSGIRATDKIDNFENLKESFYMYRLLVTLK